MSVVKCSQSLHILILSIYVCWSTYSFLPVNSSEITSIIPITHYFIPQLKLDLHLVPPTLSLIAELISLLKIDVQPTTGIQGEQWIGVNEHPLKNYG